MINPLLKVIRGEVKALIQGITGREGSFHTKLMLDYGTDIVAGVTPGKGGVKVHGVPVYDSIRDALKEHPCINTSVIFVPAKYAYDAIRESIDAGLELVVIITEGIRVHETLKLVNYAKLKGTTLIGPNSPGIICPGSRTKLGIMPGNFFKEGEVVLISRSGTLTYEIARQLSKSGLGISLALGIGGDPVVGLDFLEAIKGIEELEPRALVLIGEIGGSAEERVAEYLSKRDLGRRVVAYLAGRVAPAGRRMGHAGAIVYGRRGSYENKVKALSEAGVKIVRKPWEIPRALREILEF